MAILWLKAIYFYCKTSNKENKLNTIALKYYVEENKQKNCISKKKSN